LGQAVGLVASGIGGYAHDVLTEAAEELDRLGEIEEEWGQLLFDLWLVRDRLSDECPALVDRLEEWNNECVKRSESG